MRCNFDKEKSFVRAYTIYLAAQGNVDEYNRLLNEAFTNPDVAAKAVEEYVGGVTAPSTVSAIDPAPSSYRINSDTENIASYYIGGSGYMRMESKFKRELLSTSILNINPSTEEFSYINGNDIKVGTTTNTQWNILKYKESLLNKLRDTKITLDTTLSDFEYTSIVDSTISAFETKLNTEDVTRDSDIYDSYVILKNFDRLLKKNASYINIDKSYEKNKLEGIHKYSLNPRVEHYSGFSSNEGADIMNQVSNLADTILSIIPDVNERGEALNSSIGLSGFNGAMQTLKSAILYGNNLGENSKDFRAMYTRGAGSIIDGTYSLAEAIDSFIDNNKVPVQEGTSGFTEFRQAYLHNKLRGIKQYLLSPETPANIKNMFVQMFYKTEATGYRVYNTDAETGEFRGNNLRSRMQVTQKRGIEDAFKGGFRLLTTGSTNYAKSLLDKYNITVNTIGNNEIMTIKDTENGTQMVVDYSTDSIGNIENVNIITETPNIVNDFIQKAYSYTIPDTYESCMSGSEDYNWTNDFAPFVVMASKLAARKLGMKNFGRSLNIFDSSGGFDLKPYNSTLLNIATRLGIIYGDSVRNTIRSLGGSSLPLFQLTSLEYNFASCIEDAKQDFESPQRTSLFWDNDNFLVAPQRRNEIRFNGKIKGSSALSNGELNTLSILYDFWNPYFNNEPVLYLQNATFSDKVTQFLPGFRLDEPLKGYHLEAIYGNTVTLRDIITDSLNNGTSKISELSRRNRRDKYISFGTNILTDYFAVLSEELRNPTKGVKFPNLNQIVKDIELNNILPETDDELAEEISSRLIALDNWMASNKVSIGDLRKAFAHHGFDFKEEIHATAPKAKQLKNSARVNETLLKYLFDTQSKENWDRAEEFYKNKFKNDISEIHLNGFDNTMRHQVEKLKTWHPENQKYDINQFYNVNTKEFRLVSNDGQLHKIADSYFYIEQLLTNDFNSVLVGEVWAHVNKNKDFGANYDQYLEYSEANRLANQIKRSVIFGSTIHPFGQNIKNQEGYNCGVTPEIEIAILQDIPGAYFTPNGVSGNVDSQDGSGWCTALQARLENNSLVDAQVGDNKKTILHDIDHSYGDPTLLKWAVYSLSNSLRRSGTGSFTNVENLVRKMYNKSVTDKTFDFTTDYQNYANAHGNIWVKNRITQEYQEVIGIKHNEDGSWSRVYRNGESLPITVGTLYNIDQLFGGAWTATKNNDGTFTPNEASVDLLTDAAIKYDIRDRQIAYAVNASACKVGATNLNGSDYWYNDLDLNTYKVQTKYAGVMMDADHELDEADVTEMSQMISALIEDGRYTDLVLDIYREIGEIALNNDKVKKYIKAVNNNDRTEISRIIGESLIRSFESEDKSKLGLAQAFTKRAAAELKKSGKSIEIPISDPTIFGAFVADVTSSLSRNGIRRRYDGYAGVQNPSYNMMQYYSTAEGVKLFEQFEEECKNVLASHTTFTEDGRLLSGEFIYGEQVSYNNWSDLAREARVLSDGTQNPFWKLITSQDIDFEDTLMVPTETGGYKEVYIDNFEKYDYYRNLARPEELYVNTAAPRNLRGTDTTFTISTVEGDVLGTYSYYNLDSVRASQYLQAGLDPKDPYYEVKRALVNKVLLQGDQNIIDPVTKCNALTQDFLEKLDFGKQRRINQNIGNVLSSNDLLAEFSWQEFLGENIIANNVRLYATDYNVRPAEIIMGRYQLEKLGLTANDHIWQIKDYKYFVNKLKSQYSDPTFNADSKIIKKAYNKVLYHEGKPFLIKIGNPEIHGNDGLYENSCNEVNIIGDDIRWESEVILTTDNVDKFKFSTLSDGDNTYTLVTCSEEDFEELQDSDYFDDFYRNNSMSVDPTTEYIAIDRRIEQLAKSRFEAFKQAIEFIGARVPTQAMQSFMPFKVIAFTDTNVNQVYIPRAATALQGSDYDIDKLYLLASSLLRNGSVRSGSALQKQVGFDVAVQLFKPNGMTFTEDANGFKISERLLDEFLADPSDWSVLTSNKFVHVVNTLGQTDGRINFIQELPYAEVFERKKQQFLKMLNKHSKTKSYLRDSQEVLKTRVFNGIRNITLSAQTQLKAQITVDSCTEEMKTAAANTEGGNAEKKITPNNPASKYIMQEQGILGKADVGIGAVSLKTYFLLSTANNQKCEDIISLIQNGSYDEAANILQSMIIKNPLSDNPNDDLIVGNTNLTKVIRAIENAPDFDLKIWFLERLNALKKNISGVSSPESLSGIISLSVDNMKDLALPKLNATQDLVDIYTTAMMIGIPFGTIVKYMTSPMFNWIIRSGSNIIFDDSTDGFRVKDMLEFVVLKNIFKYFGRDGLSRIVSAYNQVRANDTSFPPLTFKKTEDILRDPIAVDAIVQAFETNNGILSKFPERFDTSEEATEARNEMIQDMIDQGISNIPSNYTRKDAYRFYRLFKILQERAKYIDENNLNVILKIADYAEEMSALGRQASINQGLKSNVRDLYNFRRAISDLVNRKENSYIKDYNKKNPNNKIEPETFNMDKFLLDENYRNYWVNHYENIKSAFNILETLTKSPNFFAMSQLVPYADSFLQTSGIYKASIELANEITNDKAQPKILSENDFKEIENYLHDTSIYDFLTHSNIEVDLNAISEITESPVEIYVNRGITNKVSLDTLKLDSALNIASFKHLMERYIIPALKSDSKYKDNSFIRDLSIKVNSRGKEVFSLPIQMMETQSDESTMAKYSKYLSDFNTLSKDSFAGQNIGGLFFLYNLIANKNSYGQQALTVIFEDLVDSVNSPKIINDYYQYIQNLDKIGVPYNVEDAIYRVANNSQGTKVISELSKIELADDFTFEMPGQIAHDSAIMSNNDIATYTVTTIGNLDANEVLTALASKFNNITIVDNEYVDKYNLPKERGFIYDGKIYLNSDSFAGSASALGVGIHEISHLILAAVKAKDINSEERKTLYNLLSKLPNDPEFDEIAKRYPNRVGSDLLEEVLCNKIEKLLTNRINQDSDFEISLLNGGFLESMFKELFPDNNGLSLNSLIDSNLEQAIELYAGSLFDFIPDIQVDYMKANQKLAALKTKLFRSTDEDYNLKQECK